MPAVAKPPVKPAAKTPSPSPAAGDEPADIKTFTPESFTMPSDDDDVTRPLEITPTPSPTPTPPVVKKTEPAPPDDPEARKKKNADIREQLEAANARARAAEEKLAEEQRAAQERLEAIQRERDELDAKHTDVSTKFAELNRSLSMEDPLRSDEVQGILKPWNDKVATIAKDISDTGGNGRQFRNVLPDLVKAYKAIGDEGSDGYEQRREQYNNLVGQFPDHAKEVRELVRNGIEVQEKARGVIEHMRNNSEEFSYQRDLKAWKALESDFAKDEMRFFSPAPEVEQSDPYNAEVLVTSLLSSSDEGKARIEKIKKFTRYVTLPLPPVNPQELAKMTSEDAAAFLESRVRQYHENQVKLRKMLPTALAAQMIIPGLMKRNRELEEELAALRGGAPPPRTNDDDHGAGGDEIADPTKFQPSNAALDDFKKNI